MKYLLALSLFFISFSSLCQNVKVGDWRDHLSYRKVNQLRAIDTKIYASTDKALFIYDKEDNSLERLNTLNGLSDIDVSALDANNQHLLIGYDNGNIDIINEGRVINLPDILNANLIANKAINHINIFNNTAYLACGFGIVVLDLEKKEVKESYFVGENNTYKNILCTAIANNQLYAATDTNIIVADLNNPNLANSANWQALTHIPSGNYNLLESFNNTLFANKPGETYNSDSLLTINLDSWSLFREPSSNTSLYADDDHLTICSRFAVHVYDTSYNQTHFFASANFSSDKNDFRACIKTDHKEFWLGDNYNGLLMYDNGNTESIMPEGPYHSDVVLIKNFGKEIWLAHGAKNENWDPTWSKQEVSSFADEEWSYTSSLVDSNFNDVVAIAKNNNDVFLGSWQDGLLHLVNNEWQTLYNESNSSLQSRAGIGDWTLIGDIQFDQEGNMWCTNSQTEFPLSVRYTDNSWEAFSLGSNVSSDQRLAKLLIDDSQRKWVIMRDNALIVFDETRSGTTAIKLSNGEGQGSLASDRVYSIAEDLDGEIWVGTDNGVSVFYNPRDVFDGETAEEILITLDGHTTHLLKGQKINDIEVDGANRKWFATNNGGVIVTSENGTEQIHNFTTDNSPLFSNKIIDIEINQETGEVFLATDKGLISYRAEATMGKPDYKEVLVFPNPVRPGYQGLISIKGLIPDAVVQITDISGNLIYETIAYGGQAVWNGKSMSGNKAQTGVYLVFCSDEDGNSNHVAKILFIKG